MKRFIMAGTILAGSMSFAADANWLVDGLTKASKCSMKDRTNVCEFDFKDKDGAGVGITVNTEYLQAKSGAVMWRIDRGYMVKVVNDGMCLMVTRAGKTTAYISLSTGMVFEDESKCQSTSREAVKLEEEHQKSN